MQKMFLSVVILFMSATSAQASAPSETMVFEATSLDTTKNELVTSISRSELIAHRPAGQLVDETPSSNQIIKNPITSYDLEKLKALSKNAQWQHLLFYKHGEAEVISPNFYFTGHSTQPKSEFSPYKELLATLENIDSVCRYPARYLWLNKQLPELKINLQNCPDLPDPNQEISLILVSSYLKNPASSFGHVLVKTSASIKEVDSVDQLSGEDLLNNSYNFGARIPQNENGVMYAIKGLFGVYDAGFSEAEFFKQDAVYSKNEQRDMWEYVLNLDEFETQLLNYHLYEAKSARFNYYFLKQNCGYRSGEILELISGAETTERLGPWYAPDYVFDQLVEYSNSSADQNNKPLVASIRYLPSEQTQLRAKFVQLSKPMQKIINSVIRTDNIAPLATLDDAEKALAIDFLIMHRTYKISQKNTPEHQRFKKKLLAQRFTLTASNELATLKVPKKISPALSNKTSQTKVVLSDEKAQVGLSLFVKDPLNTHTDIDKRFEAVQVSLGYDFDDNQLSLTDFVFLDMQQIENIAQPLAGEPKLSWQLKTGARTDEFTGDNHSIYALGGIGTGIVIGEHMLGYSLVNAVVHDQNKHLDIGLELGLRVKKQRKAAELTYNITKREDRSSLYKTELTLRQQLSKNDDTRIMVTYTDTGSSNYVINNNNNLGASISWHHYW